MVRRSSPSRREELAAGTCRGEPNSAIAQGEYQPNQPILQTLRAFWSKALENGGGNGTPEDCRIFESYAVPLGAVEAIANQLIPLISKHNHSSYLAALGKCVGSTMEMGEDRVRPIREFKGKSEGIGPRYIPDVQSEPLKKWAELTVSRIMWCLLLY